MQKGQSQPFLRLTHHKVATKAAKPNGFFGARKHVSERWNERRSKENEDSRENESCSRRRYKYTVMLMDFVPVQLDLSNRAANVWEDSGMLDFS